jgi:hypothetical protein
MSIYYYPVEDASTALQEITSTDGSVTVSQAGTTVDLSVASGGGLATDVVCLVRNNTGATLTKGTAVYINGAIGQNPTVTKAIATSDSTSAQTLGVMTANLANNSNGYVTIIGLVTDLDTSAFTDGQQLYLSPTTAGTLTSTKQYAPNHLVYVAVVEHAHPTQGKLFVKVQNGYEMDELHNVSAQTPANGDTLVYNTTTQLWESSKVNLTNGVSGVLPIANGGTGAATAAEAFSDLTPLTLTTASATALVLTNTSGYQQQIIGSTNQVINLPSTATLAVGWSFLITNGTGFTVTVLTSTGASVYANSNIGSYRVWCISTANNNAVSWSAGAETFSFETGSGSVVRGTTPTIASATLTSPTATGAIAFTGTTSQAAQFATSQTTGNTTICSSQTSGTLILGGASGTGIQTIGRSTVNQTTNIQAGATASGSTKAINIGTEGLSGSTTNIAIGSAVAGATSRTTLNGIVINSITDGINAAGTTQGTAKALTTNINNVTVVTAAAAGVILPTAVAGMRILVRNSDSADTLSIYPATGGTINALAANAAFTLAAGSTIELMATTTTQWYTF